MNPKSIICLICLVSVQSILAQSMSLKEFNYYKNIAYQYDINPPQLEYGYPWWYDIDSVDYHGVIFLKEDLSFPIENLAENVWVCEPEVETAQQIWEETTFKQDYIPYFKYLVVPDSGVHYREMETFLDSLNRRIGIMKVSLYSINGTYVPVKNEIIDMKKMLWNFCGIFRHEFTIYMNRNLEYLVQYSTRPLDSISGELEKHFTANLFSEMDPVAWSYSTFDTARVNSKIIQCQEVLQSNINDSLYLMNEIKKWKQLKSWVQAYGEMRVIGRYSTIMIKLKGTNLTSIHLYRLLDEIQVGLLRARQFAFQKWNYQELYALRQFDKLNFIHAQIPDLIKDYDEINNVIDVLVPTPIPQATAKDI